MLSWVKTTALPVSQKVQDSHTLIVCFLSERRESCPKKVWVRLFRGGGIKLQTHMSRGHWSTSYACHRTLSHGTCLRALWGHLQPRALSPQPPAVKKCSKNWALDIMLLRRVSEPWHAGVTVCKSDTGCQGTKPRLVRHFQSSLSVPCSWPTCLCIFPWYSKCGGQGSYFHSAGTESISVFQTCKVF